jgi:2-amino-4-hydroxy-6-hydroxymethyldihydropteridine diphosphokinase
MGKRRVALALGSNLGAREAHLAAARRAIAAACGAPVAVSRIYETEPVGPAGQGRYLNQVVVLETDAEAEALVARLLEIERALGRVRAQRWGPRTIDIDLLLCGDETHAGALACVPHPRLAQRGFVLAPLAEVMPDWRHPAQGASVREMLAACDARGVEVWSGAGRAGGEPPDTQLGGA